jgi:hypothetical protein
VWFITEPRTLSICDACPVAATTSEQNTLRAVASQSDQAVGDLFTTRKAGRDS